MAGYRHLELFSRGPISVIRLLSQRRYSLEEVAELVEEWNCVADHPDCRTLVVDCSRVVVLSSAVLGRLIALEQRLRQKEGRLVLCGVRAEARQMLSWTKLDRLFEIQEEVEEEAMAFA